ncbi:MAG TPA: Ig-like domain-containing protein, partial [Spirochaetales bacterium]|nr:Ig-like domain-containing protein [Spirochaetales bacterium]
STNVEAKYYLIKNTPIVESDYGEPIWTHITTTPFSTTHAIESGDGPKVVYIMLRDETGNIYSTMYEKDIYLDTALPDAPTITITYSGTHYYYVKGTQTISASSSDSVGIKDIKIHVNTVLKGASSVSPCSCTWDTTLYSNNTTYPVRVDVYDLAGNSATATETRKVDNEPPTKAPNFTSMPGTLINDPTPTWTWQAAFESGGNGIFSTKFGGALYGSESTETSYTAPTLPNGSFVFRVREHDYAGNYGPEKDYTVTIDLLPPGTPNLTYSSVTQTIFKFDWTSGGGGNGLYDFEMNDSTPDAYQNQNVLTYTSLPLPDGTHYFYVKEHDSAGNLSSYASAKITINITTVSPDNGAATYKSSVLLDWPDPMYLYFDDVEISFNGSNWTRVAEDITAGSYQQTMSTGTIKYYWRIIRTGKIGTTILGPYQFTNHF